MSTLVDVSPTKVGIIGAGPAGLTAAYLLSQAAIEVDVWETDSHYVGGISRTEVYKGFRFDIGGHRFFSKSEEVEAFWSEILPNDMLTRNRLSRIYYREKFYNYPLDAAEVIGNLGKRLSFLSVASYAKAKITARPTPRNLEEWVTRQFGGRLYQMFFKSYTEKVWGMPCTQISADWAAQRIKGLSLSKAARHALLPRRLTSRNRDQPRADVIKTLITSFRYPRLGPGMLWEATAALVLQQGGHVHMGARVEGIERSSDERWRVNIRTSGGMLHSTEVDQLISSAPLGWLVRTIQPPLPAGVQEAAAALRYRDFLTVALILRPSIHFPDNWLYIHDPQFHVGRIQNFAN